MPEVMGSKGHFGPFIISLKLERKLSPVRLPQTFSLIINEKASCKYLKVLVGKELSHGVSMGFRTACWEHFSSN